MKKIAKYIVWAFISVVWSLPATELLAQNTMLLEQINNSFAEHSKTLPGERFFMQVDKTLYQPGETIWFAGYLCLSKQFQKPGLSQVVHVQLKDQNGRIVQSVKLLNNDGKVLGDFELDPSILQGDYEIEAYTHWQRNGQSPYIFRQDIRVEQLERPRVMADVNFKKESYSGGDVLEAEAILYDGHYQLLSEKKGQCDLLVAGEKIASMAFQSDQEGKAKIELELPSYLRAGGIELLLIFDHLNLREELHYRVPYTAGSVSIRFFPEGGDLIKDQNSRVAFQISDINGHSVDAVGYIIDDKGKLITDFESDYDGMGIFNLKPAEGRSYTAIITEPSGIPGVFPLPAALDAGVSLRVDKKDNERITIQIASDREQVLMLTATVRENLCYSELHKVEKGVQQVEINTRDFPAGVARFTLFDTNGIPSAERLAFMHADQQLNIQMDAGKPVFSAGEKVKLELMISDPQGMPVKGSFSLAVTDDHLRSASGVELTSILPGLLLFPDIRGHVKDAAALFDPANPNAEKRLDLILMTHGWRHFTWEEILSGNPVAIQYEPELRVVEGYVFDDSISNRVKNLKIKVADSKYSVKTDETGYFCLEGLDLLKPVAISYRDIHGKWSEYLLTGYTDSLLIDIATQYEFKEGEKSILKTEENAQFMASGTAAIKGRITDAATGKPMPYANVQAEVNGRMINGCSTDENGYYTIKPLPPGRIDVLTSSMGYSPYTIKGVLTKSRQIINLDIEVEKNVAIVEELHIADDAGQKIESRLQVAIEDDETHQIDPTMMDDSYFSEPDTIAKAVVQTATKTRKEEQMSTYELPPVIIEYEEPLVPFEQTMTGRTITQEEFERIPRRTVDGAASATAGVFSLDGEVGNVRGARSDQTVYYIDGVRVIGDASVPALGIAEVAVFLGGIPAEYGDCRGGVIEITTRSPSMYNTYELRDKKREVINLPQLPVYHRVRQFPDFVSNETNRIAEDDDRSTLLWVGDLQTDENGKASIEFFTSGVATDFRIILEGISEEGDLGHAEAIITTYKR